MINNIDWKFSDIAYIFVIQLFFYQYPVPFFLFYSYTPPTIYLYLTKKINVVDFGLFIDIGLHDDGLAHISKLSKNYIKHPSELFSVFFFFIHTLLLLYTYI